MPPNLALAACSAVSKCGCYQEGRWLASLWQSKSMKLFFSRKSRWLVVVENLNRSNQCFSHQQSIIYDPSQYELYNSGIQSIELNLGNAAWPSLQIKLLSIVVSFSLVFFLFFFFFHLLFFSIFFFICLFPVFCVFCSLTGIWALFPVVRLRGYNHRKDFDGGLHEGSIGRDKVS
jgi:hypothetical protein